MKLKLIAAGLFLSTSAFAAPLDDAVLEAKARAIHEKVVALDTHVDIPMDYMTASMDAGALTKAQVDLPKMRGGGLDAAFFIVYTPQGPLTDEGYAEAKTYVTTKLAAIHRLVDYYPGEIALAATAKDVARIDRSGRKVALIGMENPYPLGPSPTQADIDAIAAAGVRYCGITHFGHNQFGDSSNGNLDAGDLEEKWGGLSPKGRELVAMLNRAGIMVDVSHASAKSMMQAIEVSKAPIIASHSSVKKYADVPRNMDEEQLKVLAQNGGVIQITAVDVYLKPYTAAQLAVQARVRKEMGLEDEDAREAMSDATRAEYEKRLGAMWEISPRASVVDLVDAVDHAVSVAGIDHVGISSDFDGGGGIEDWDDASETLNITRELVKRGYSEQDIAKLWSGNLLRVMEEVRKTGEAIRKNG